VRDRACAETYLSDTEGVTSTLCSNRPLRQVERAGRYMSEGLRLAAFYANTFLWALLIPMRWPTFARHFAGDWSDVENDV
jgi:hypothetical protein